MRIRISGSGVEQLRIALEGSGKKKSTAKFDRARYDAGEGVLTLPLSAFSGNLTWQSVIQISFYTDGGLSASMRLTFPVEIIGEASLASSIDPASAPPPVPSAVTVSVNTAQKIKSVSHRPVGINADYLMDGSILDFKIPFADQIASTGARYIRYPGGNKSDNYLWSAAPWEKSRPHGFIYGVWPFHREWGARWFNEDGSCRDAVLDFDEFMTSAKKIGAEPLIVVPYDNIYRFRDKVTNTDPLETELRNAEEWVRYANVVKRYGVKYWEIGNEVWLGKDFGPASRYREDIVKFSTRMKKADPSIRIVVNGDSASWFSELLTSAEHIDCITRSIYPLQAFDGGYDAYRVLAQSLTAPALDDMRTALAVCADTGARARIKIIVSEYNNLEFAAKSGWSNVSDLGKTLAVFQIAAELLAAPDVEFACFWNTRWISTNIPTTSMNDAMHKDGSLNTPGKALSILGLNLLENMVEVKSTSPYVLAWSCADVSGNAVHVFLINKDHRDVDAAIHVNGSDSMAMTERWTLSGNGPGDMNPVLRKEKTAGSGSVRLPGISISMIAFRK